MMLWPCILGVRGQSKNSELRVILVIFTLTPNSVQAALSSQVQKAFGVEGASFSWRNVAISGLVASASKQLDVGGMFGGNPESGSHSYRGALESMNAGNIAGAVGRELVSTAINIGVQKMVYQGDHHFNWGSTLQDVFTPDSGLEEAMGHFVNTSYQAIKKNVFDGGLLAASDQQSATNSQTEKREPSLLDQSLDVLQLGFQGLTNGVIGVKELAFGLAKLPLDFALGGVGEAFSNHLGDRVPADPGKSEPNSFLHDLWANPLSVVERSFSDTLEAASWGFTHNQNDDSFGASIDRLLNGVPVVGRFLSEVQAPVSIDSSPARTIVSPGIHQLPGDWETNIAAGQEMRVAGAPESETVLFKNGTVVDVAFGLLNFNNGASAHFANQVAALGDKKVNLVGHSGGVQVTMGATSYLGDIGIAVDHIIGLQGPTLGAYNNASTMSLRGNAFTSFSKLDFVSAGGAVLSPFVFGRNVDKDYSVKIPDGAPKHKSPSSRVTAEEPHNRYWIDHQANPLLNKK